MKKFSATVRKIGVNPYVAVPPDVLKALFTQAGQDRRPIPVRGRLNGQPFLQTVVKYAGAWRLYLNTEMRTATGTSVGDVVTVALGFDAKPRDVPMVPQLARALARAPKAKAAFDLLAPSRQKEILRYLGSLKNETTVTKNVDKVIRHLETPPGALSGRAK